ncbi:MAG: type II toxin-antitoxin system VapC family toxin [Candidatus Hydrogenedentes bacterium]|nr:type II toxin-antitoxin system VapC family toxin [Candidatus Hydrogenedentota bacterium]
MPFMLDSCVYLDVFTRDSKWFSWSSRALSSAADVGAIILNPVIYAEISVRFERIEELEEVLPSGVFEYRAIPREAAFLAAKCFARYRRRGGSKLHPLPDFFIGAHAAVENHTLVTRDPLRFSRYFPSVKLVKP